MNAPHQAVISPNLEMKMKEKLQIQRESYLQEGFVDADTRFDRIDRAIDAVNRRYDIPHSQLEPLICTIICALNAHPK